MTTPYDIKISPIAHRQIFALPHSYQKSVLKMLDTLSINPRPPGAKKIDGLAGLYSESLLHLRLIYRVEDQEILLLLVKKEGG